MPPELVRLEALESPPPRCKITSHRRALHEKTHPRTAERIDFATDFLTGIVRFVREGDIWGVQVFKGSHCLGKN